MHVVWHVAAMGNWQAVVKEQLRVLKESELDDITCTFVGKGLDWFLLQCISEGIRVYIAQANENISHYETFAMLHIEKFVKTSEEPVLYLHTKGVSQPQCSQRPKWRKVMHEMVIRRWKQNLGFLTDFDAVGVNWIGGVVSSNSPHFSGNFWLARAEWLRKLPNFVKYHASRGFIRLSCESWIGSAGNCKYKSLLCTNRRFWDANFNWDQLLKQIPSQLEG